MANQSQSQPQPKALEAEAAAHNHQREEENETEQLQELEMLVVEVNQMAQRILDFRASLPNQLKSTLATFLSAQRLTSTLLPNPDDGPEPGTSGNPNSDVGRSVETGSGVALAEEDLENAHKIRFLKYKILSNASAMPVVLKRMKDCMYRIDKLDSCNGIIHPAFNKRKQPS